MTPKEKAKDLFDKYWEEIEIGYDNSKHCALIAVDEILKVLCTPHKNESEYMYWQEVKQEIEKL
jgi:hypothetical protein